MQPESGKATIPPKKPLFWKLLLPPFLVFHTLLILSQILSWTDHWAGFLTGVFFCVLFFVFWVFTVLPWALLVSGVYRWRGWRRFRSFLILAPAWYLCGHAIATLIQYPPTAAGIFYQRTEVRLPEPVRHLNWHTSGGGFDGFAGNFTFGTTREETDRLIRELELRNIESMPAKKYFQNLPPQFSPDEMLTLFSRDTGFRTTTLVTNPTRTEVHINFFPGGEGEDGQDP